SNFKHITIDGTFDDWAGVAPAYVDPAFADDPTFPDNPSKFDGATDLKAVYVAHDDQYLYVRFTLYAAGDPFTSHNNVFIDAENAQFNTVDVAPDTEGLTYTFTTAPSAATESSALVSLTNTDWRVNASGTDLGTAWREVAYDDASAGWTNGLGLFGFAPDPSI